MSKLALFLAAGAAAAGVGYVYRNRLRDGINTLVDHLENAQMSASMPTFDSSKYQSDDDA